MRANYQVCIWEKCLEPTPDIPSPVGYGWCKKGSELALDWMDGLPSPQAVLELLSCNCTRTCKGSNCPCVRNGLKCSDMCRLINCDNQDIDIDDEEVDICNPNEEDSDDD